ncbi:MAG: bifunctional response regulator/alkaline phosphatase family protein [Fermentimonas sp.]|nr:bifunctional response regulator/alkaline phosphatase family protein [Fermentimonas sp.]
MDKAQFLWVDDEIDLLKPHILFLEEKGYATECATNGYDAIKKCNSKTYDIIFLDEHMPGLTGLDTLTEIKESSPNVPVVMITKSEDEGIMDKAIGKKIADYLIKPVNPTQVLTTIKKILEKKKLVSETVSETYRKEYNILNEAIRSCMTCNDWIDVYRRLVFWEVELDRYDYPVKELPEMQKADANISFAKFVRENYKSWINRESGDKGNISGSPVVSSDLFENHVFPFLDKGDKLFFILIDNFRLDQWEVIKDIVNDSFECEENIYFSILPTATPYARNSIFSGLLPSQISEMYPDFWVEESDDERKNKFEAQLIGSHLQRVGRTKAFSYHKVSTNREGNKLSDRFKELENYDLNVIVYNFIDLLSHARTESNMLKELAADESSYRSLTRSWFLHSPLVTLLKKVAAAGFKAVITTDHGSIRVKNGLKVIGDRETNTNLRYKLGKNLAYDPKRVFDIIHPGNYGLPEPNISTRYIFALNRDFFVYPNNYNQIETHFENTFQHGGISMEEMMIPVILLKPK